MFRTPAAKVHDHTHLYVTCLLLPQVHKAECPGTFVIGPELSMNESLELAAGGGGPAKQGLSQWTDGIAAIFKGGCDKALVVAHNDVRIQKAAACACLPATCLAIMLAHTAI